MFYLVGFGLMLTILLGLFAVLEHCSTFPHHLVFVLFIASLYLTREKKFLQNFISSRDGPVQMKTCKKTNLLWNDGGKERQEDYPTGTSAVYAADEG